MRMSLVAVGKLRPGPYRDLARSYARKLAPFCKLEVVEVPHAEASLTEAEQVRWEARRIMPRLEKAQWAVAFDRQGKQVASEAFARTLGGWRDQGKEVLLMIGGPAGLDREIVHRAGDCISFSKLTFPHELFRILLLEQLYRGFTILAGHPYHR